MTRSARLARAFAFTIALAVAGGGWVAIPAAENAATPPPSVAPAVPDPPPIPPEAEAEGVTRRIGEKVAIGSSLNVAADEIVVGDAVCIGCRGRIDGQVLGDIVVVAGTLDLAGSATGDLVAIASKVDLEEQARVGGDVVNVGGSVRREDAQIGGQVVDLGLSGALLGGLGGLTGIGGALGLFDAVFGLWFTVLTWVLLVVVLLLLAALVPERIVRIAQEVPVVPVQAFLWGLLAYTLLPLTIVLLLVSCIGIPVLPFAYFAFKIFKWLGMAGIFLVVGRSIGRWFGRDVPLLGGLLLGMAPFLILRFLPFCIGWIAWFVLEIFGIGYAIATRAGRPVRADTIPTPPVLATDPPPAAP